MMNTTIQKWGNSQAVRLPRPILEAALLQENDLVEIVAEDNAIIIKKVDPIRKRRAKRSLEERFKDYNGDYKCSEVDWGEPMGEEVW